MSSDDGYIIKKLTNSNIYELYYHIGEGEWNQVATSTDLEKLLAIASEQPSEYGVRFVKEREAVIGAEWNEDDLRTYHEDHSFEVGKDSEGQIILYTGLYEGEYGCLYTASE